ncbi:MAG: hypothetical protein H5T72_07780 [Actinobacteria bacterium]|nr:hypothetical protein [Actinomycetota bacterium]
MRLDLMTRKRITQEVAKRYRKAGKKEKGRILDGFRALTGYNRSYAASVLRKGPSRRAMPAKSLRPVVTSRRGRKPFYGAEVNEALVKVWAVLDCPCGKRLHAAVPHTLAAPGRFGETGLKDGAGFTAMHGGRAGGQRRGVSGGDRRRSLDSTDVKGGWAEPRAPRSKAQVRV